VSDENRRRPEVLEILALIDGFGEALHSQDLAASMELLDPTSDLAVIPSEGVDVHLGHDAVAAFLAHIYAGPRRYGWRWNDRWVSLQGQTAWFVAVGDETVEQGSSTHTIPYCLTGVAVRTAGGWRLRLLHGSEDWRPLQE
jgi:hypothetical protein